MEILLLLLLFFVISIMASSLREAEMRRMGQFKSEPKEKKCPPHRWRYNKENRLQCEDCFYAAGSDYVPRGSNE